MLHLPSSVLSDILKHVREGHPHEVCGVLLAPLSARQDVARAVALKNVQDRYHALDPVQFPRTSRTAYRFHDLEHLRVLEAARAEGLAEVGIYHSHIEAGAYFSDEDVAQALWEGGPRFPGVDYLVVGTREGRPAEAALFTYDAGRFVGTSVRLEE